MPEEELVNCGGAYMALGQIVHAMTLDELKRKAGIIRQVDLDSTTMEFLRKAYHAQQVRIKATRDSGRVASDEGGKEVPGDGSGPHAGNAGG